MKIYFLLLALLVGLAGCAMPKHPAEVADSIRIEPAWYESADCKHRIEQAKNFDEKLVERWSIRLGLSAALGPLSWPITWWRERQHNTERDAVIAALENDCKRPVISAQ